MNDVLVIAGPTASGKSRLAYLIAKNTGGEVIVADSMKVYRTADIGTSKPPSEYRDNVNYHLMDMISPDDRYDVGSFCRDASSIIDSLHSRKKLPVIAGGTALYVMKLTEGLADMPEVSSKIIRELESLSSEDLYEELCRVDPKRASELHPNMRKRIIRALGIYRSSGKRMSEYILETKPPSYNFKLLTIEWKRETLYNRIDKRVDKMISQGLVDEVRELYTRYGPDAPVFEGVGYRQLIPYIENRQDIAGAVGEIKKATRNYAKQQLTWWRNRDILRLDGTKLISVTG
ncbi:MAG: tRNA (adenosine(37)-N6)-dimethylallyltransferase MiaA [Elusimicrobiota bacterium]